MTRSFKFGLVVPEEFHTHAKQHSFEISGLLQWAKVLGGDIVLITDDLTPYDILMTNVSSTEQEYISVIRQENPDAKIVTCFDYGFDVVNQYFYNMERVKQVMRRTDHIFSVNKNQVKWMKLLLPERDIRYIPHPTDIENVKKFRKTKEERTMGVAVMWHQYDNYMLQPLEIMLSINRKRKIPVPFCLVGAKSRILIDHGWHVPAVNVPIISNDHPDSKMRGKPIDPEFEKYVVFVQKGLGFDSIMPYMGVEPWYDHLSRFAVALDLYTVNSIGRFGIDCAGVGVPCVASDLQDSANLLWPFTRVDPFEPEKPIAFVEKLLNNQDFYSHTLKVADKNLPYFGFEKSRERMMALLED